MVSKFLALSSTLLLAFATMGCGSSDSSNETASPSPVTPPPALKLELLSGTVSADMSHCVSSDGTAASARYLRLLRATAYEDAVYLTESDEGCTNISYDARGITPLGVQPAIRKISGGRVETALRLHSYISAMSHPVMVRYPSGFVRTEGGRGGVILGYVAASSDRAFTLNEAEVARYTEQGGWDYYVPGLFKLTDPIAGYDDLVAGMPGKPPARVDGAGKTAGFVAPHDLEVNAAGMFYVIDDGRIRTIDASYHVQTLDHAALGIQGAVKTLDSDLQGNIHALAQRGAGSYTWHNLSDGSKVDFRTREITTTEPVTAETFAVIGKEILMGVRLPSGGTSLYRIASNGEVRELTGSQIGTPQNAVDRPSQYLLPAVQHIEYGRDGHLYIVLPQGVLIARDYT